MPAAVETQAVEPQPVEPQPVVVRSGGFVGWLRWLFRPRLCFGGLVVGLAFFWMSLTPSLLPRVWLFQGGLSGIAFAIGYGIGSAASALLRHFLRSEPSPKWKRAAWIGFAVGASVGSVVLLFATHGWQNELRRLFGMENEPEFSGVGVVAIAAILGAFLLLGARLVRSFARFVIRQVDRVTPRKASVPIGLTLVAIILFGFWQGFLWRGTISALNNMSSVVNGDTDPGTERPTAAERSGSPDSAVAWDSLGRMGRNFVARGPSRADLETFHGPGCCQAPIRVYVGLDSADSADARAALAVEELERTGAFERKVLGVFQATGTGWINPRVADSLEYIHGGDTAEVSMQYSFLPSWVSFLVDQTKAEEAGQALIGAVLQRVNQLPAAERPKVFVFGESLGSYGTEQAFDDVADMQSQVDGALLVGPTFANPIWKHLTDSRLPGSPEWRPELDPSMGVAFGGTPADLKNVNEVVTAPRVVYLENASDPITWWNVELGYRKPDWAGDPAAPDRSPSFRWFPIVTFWQVAGDLVDSLGVPAGHGHYFGANVANGWLAVDTPAGWTASDTTRLRTVLANSR